MRPSAFMSARIRFASRVRREPRNAQADPLTGACDENRSPCERHGIAAVHFETFRLWLKMRWRLMRPTTAFLRPLALRGFVQRRSERLPVFLRRVRDGLRVGGTLQQ